MATANPAMTEAAYERARRADTPAAVMTVSGAQTAVLVLILLATAAFTWSRAAASEPGVA